MERLQEKLLQKKAKSLPKVILFGDSLTAYSFHDDEGFGSTLTKHYGGRAEVEDHGYPGFTTRMLRNDFRSLIQGLVTSQAPPPLFFTIFLGANDACGPGYTSYVPVEEYEEHIRTFVDAILREEKLEQTKIVLITPPPISISGVRLPEVENLAELLEIKKGGKPYLIYNNKRLYARKIMQIAASYAEKRCPVVGLNLWDMLVIDAWNRLGPEQEVTTIDEIPEDRLPGSGLPEAQPFPKGYFSDGLHFGTLGNTFVSKQLTDLLADQWPELLSP